MKKLISVCVICCLMSISLVGCLDESLSGELMVNLVLKDQLGQEFFNDEIESLGAGNLDPIMLNNVEAVYGSINYSGENLTKLRVTFSSEGQPVVAFDVYNNTSKTFESGDLWGYLISIGAITALTNIDFDLDFFSGTDDNGMAFNTMDFYFGDLVDSLNIVATTESGGTFITAIVRENDGNNEDQYVLTTSVSPMGSGTVTGSGTYDAGTEVPVSATPANDNWEFSHWTVNGTMASHNPGTIMMDSDVDLVAVFTAINTVNNYVLSTSVQGQGTVTGAGTYPAGTVVPVSATPASDDWEFSHWLVNGTVGNSNPGTVTMDGDVSLVAIFTTDANPGGLINIDLNWGNGVLTFNATNANPGVIGLELYHQRPDKTVWIERQTFAVNNNGMVSGTVTRFRPNVLRFSVVDQTTTGGYVPLENLSVEINGKTPPLVEQNGSLAFQVDVSTL